LDEPCPSFLVFIHGAHPFVSVTVSSLLFFHCSAHQRWPFLYLRLVLVCHEAFFSFCYFPGKTWPANVKKNEFALFDLRSRVMKYISTAHIKERDLCWLFAFGWESETKFNFLKAIDSLCSYQGKSEDRSRVSWARGSKEARKNKEQKEKQTTERERGAENQRMKKQRISLCS
jgi:hypothetical protein